MLAKLFSVALAGIDALPVEVELDLGPGMVGLRLVGMPDKAVQEAADRVRAALRNSGYDFPARKMVVNLAPAELKKEGAVYDLPIALAVLLASEQLTAPAAGDYLIMGELALDGALRPVRGALAAAITARQQNFKGIILPQANAAEAAVLGAELPVVAVKTLSEAVQFLSGELPAPLLPAARPESDFAPELCFSEVRGQEYVKRALEVAAAGGHNLLMLGPPGSGKTMCAQRLPTILPELEFAESLAVTKIYSVAGELPAGGGLLRRRPFRHPHHSASAAGLIGGGANPRPGEISLAHHGVLFLDEAPEFPRALLEALRQPLEDGKVTISRAASSAQYPANIMLVAAMNLCPCGNLGDQKKTCKCSPQMVERYIGRLSGPLLDRIDIHVEAPAVSYEDLRGARQGETSVAIRRRVAAARELQRARQGKKAPTINARLGAAAIEKHCQLDADCEMLLKTAVNNLGLSARACSRVLKVARTAADLAGAENIGSSHLSEAIQYRLTDRRRAY